MIFQIDESGLLHFLACMWLAFILRGNLGIALVLAIAAGKEALDPVFNVADLMLSYLGIFFAVTINHITEKIINP